MYSSFYHLSGAPFQLTPDPDFFFASRSHDRALSYLAYGLSQDEGIIALTGEEGTGRSTLLAHFLASLDQERYVPVALVASHLKADTVVQNIATRLGLAGEALPQHDLLARVHGVLDRLHTDGQRVLVILDEADDATAAFLDAVRSVTDYSVDGASPVQLVLVGGPELRQRLDEDSALEPVRQRIIASCRLAPLADTAETGAYIRHRMELAGWKNDPVITEAAVAAIHRFCGGVPRRINQLCSRLLLHGYLESLHEIDQGAVEKVISELVADDKNSEEDGETMTKSSNGAASGKASGNGWAESRSLGPEEEPSPAPVAFDRRSVIETDVTPNPKKVAHAAATVEPLVEPAADDEPTLETEPAVPGTAVHETPEPQVAVPSDDQQLVDIIVSELARIDPAIPRLIHVRLFGEEGAPDGPDALATTGDSRRLGMGPMTASMLYRSALRELAGFDRDLLRASLSGTVANVDLEHDASQEADDSKMRARLEALEDRMKANEKLLTKAVKALKRLK
ncbi:MAG: AAA family ATPase [Alphaproteobacteria bacterium]